MSDQEPPTKKAKNMSANGSGAGKNGAGSSDGKAGAGEAEGHFDHNLYSRQLYALGETAMRRLRTSSVLVAGLGGVGVEIAKNLILGGVRHVTVQDDKAATAFDLGAQYYLGEADVGRNRCEASREKLAELNDSVTLAASAEPLTAELVAQHDLTVLTDAPYAVALKTDAWARAAGKKFLFADIRGLHGLIFNDFGPAHRVDDPDGEQAAETLLEHMDKTTGLCLCLEDARHNLEDGDTVTFSEVKGLPELNDPAFTAKVSVKTPSQFTIDPELLAKLPGSYLEGGRVKKLKVPKEHAFKEMTAATLDPEHLITDFAKMELPGQLHVCWQALSQVWQKEGALPKSKADAEALAAAAAELNAGLPDAAKVGEVDAELCRRFAASAASQLVSMAGYVGGVAAQEAMKGLTGLYTPLKQFAYMDAEECRPAAEWSSLALEDAVFSPATLPKGSRYDSLAAVFGWDFVAALQKESWFVVGAGAIGCELLKNFALLGLGCGEGGKLTVTDMDQIELSNLNRQFLFRRHDVGSKKSECAAAAAKAFNGALNIEALTERVGPDTEALFSDAFFDGLSGVANALDNVDARTYMDRRCVFYRLPLLESGTMGPKGNTQVVYPHLTESYSSSTDPPEKSIPICTLKNFPNAIEHTIQWARDQFEGLFTNPAETANAFLADERGFLARLEKMQGGQKMELLSDVAKALRRERLTSHQDAVVWARKLFDSNFDHSIRQLLHNFPADQLTSTGVKFWSGAKRCPTPIAFDRLDNAHLDFVAYAAQLRCELFGVKPTLSREEVGKAAAAVAVEPFQPKEGVKIAVTEAEAKEESGDAGEDDVNNLLVELAKLSAQEKARLAAVDFEKDDDSNHHVDWITACSNLRAANYQIAPADAIATKKIAGRIIPALATTTAAVAGLVALELLKVVAAGKARKLPLDRMKNTFLNLALPFVASSEPIEAPKKKYGETEWTLWDSIDIQGPMTLGEFEAFFKEKHGLELSMLSVGVSMIFSFFMDGKKKAERLGMKIEDLIKEVTKKEIPAHQRSLVLEPMFDGPDGEEVETPYVKYLLPK